MLVIRTDRGVALAAPLSGTLYEGKAGSIHDETDPLIYLDGPEYRTVDEVESIAKQLAGKPFTLLHPDGLIADGAVASVIGQVVAGRVENGYAVATIMVSDKRGLDAIENGNFALSLGYRCLLDNSRHQRQISVDHLALVPVPRCKTCFLRADSHDYEETCACALRTDAVHMKIDMTDAIKKALDDYMTAMKMRPECGMTGGDHKDGCKMKMDSVLHAKERNALATEEFAVPESRKLPIHDEAHVRAAMSRFSQTDFSSSAEKMSAFHKIMAKAHHFGIDTAGFAKAHGDHVDSCTCNSRATSYTTGEQPMADEKTTDLAAEMAALNKKLEEAHAALTKLEIEATNARKDAEAYKAKVDGLEADVKKSKEDADAAVAKAKTDAADALATEVQTRVDARVALIVEAKPFLADADLSKMSDRDIKCAVIKHIDKDEVAAEKSMDYVTGVYEGALKRANAATASRETVRVTLNEMRKDTATLTGIDAERAAKANMSRESASAWTK